MHRRAAVVRLDQRLPPRRPPKVPLRVPLLRVALDVLRVHVLGRAAVVVHDDVVAGDLPEVAAAGRSGEEGLRPELLAEGAVRRRPGKRQRGLLRPGPLRGPGALVTDAREEGAFVAAVHDVAGLLADRVPWPSILALEVSDRDPVLHGLHLCPVPAGVGPLLGLEPVERARAHRRGKPARVDGVLADLARRKGSAGPLRIGDHLLLLDPRLRQG
mmetsp:Transcript_63569/g.186524  ORF Transcript_63569/g.186524 Transcript_63569/m.186524 type:complete len:215 (+) Transcript_63569:841-1485(+)